MKENELKNIFEKYKKGESSLKEERELFNNSENSERSSRAWSAFIKKNKTEVPQGLNERLWKSFQKKKAAKRRRIIPIISVAASILLIISVFLFSHSREKQTYAEKERLLQQALDLFESPEREEIQRTVFYENEMIILYTYKE